MTHSSDKLNEPPQNAPKDYILNLDEERWEFDLVSGLLQRQYDNIEKIDTKLASLLAAAGAAMYFFLDKATTIGDMVVAGLFIIPLVKAMMAFQALTFLGTGPRAIVDYFGSAPRETRLVAIGDMVTSFDKNASPLGYKANNFNRALWCAIGISILTVVLRVLEAMSPGLKSLMHPLGS